MSESLLADLAGTLVLGALLDSLRAQVGDYELLAHWEQGEFHHDVVLALPTSPAPLDDTPLRDTPLRDAPFRYLVVATNCNGGVKEVLAFSELPDRDSLWLWRCPQNTEFTPQAPFELRGRAITTHWFDPCELLLADARSELRPEHRERQHGGGWKKAGCR